MIMTPTEALMRQAQTRPDDTALIFKGEVWTYRRFADEAERVARGLAANGVRAGDRVALHMMNRPEMLIAYYACFRLGAIAAPLRTAFTFAELEPMLKRLQPALYIGESILYPNVAPTPTEVLARQNRILIDGADTHGVRPWEVLRQAGASAHLPTHPSHEPAVLLNTSGTTGQPKFVVHTPDTLGATADLVAKHFSLSADDVIVSPLALAHASGLFTSISFIRLGLPVVILDSPDPGIMLDAVERHHGTWLFGFPYQYATLVAAQRSRSRNVSSLRVCLTGGDICPVELQEQVAAVLGAPLYNIWAATEVVGSVTFGLQPGPVVRILKDAQLRIVDDEGNDVADGEVGELLVRGPNVFAAYWNDPEATMKALRGGWYRSGDLMRRGDGDDLWFVARKRDIIIRGGTNISPMEIEDALLACHPAVEEAAVVGKPDPVLGQRVIGFVKLAPGAKRTATAEILQNVAGRLAPYKLPEDIIEVEALPRNALSKVDRRALEAIAHNRDELGKSAA
jgi:acyl-coenzyme A synthetase/AMP-(fatty) acid ligase